MDLKLTAHQGKELLGNRASVLVDADVYSVGRGNDNSWVLPDPRLHISNKHCVIHRKNNEFHITDISTNGVYLNGSSDPLGRGRSQVLKQGDVLVIGEYTVYADMIGSDAYSENLAETPTHQELDQSTIIAEAMQEAEPRDMKFASVSDVVRDALTHPDSVKANQGSHKTAVSELVNSSAAPTGALSSDPTISELLRPIAPEKAYYVPPKVQSAAQPDQKHGVEMPHAEDNNHDAIPDNWLDLVAGNESETAAVHEEMSQAAVSVEQAEGVEVTSQESVLTTQELGSFENAAPPVQTEAPLKAEPYIMPTGKSSTQAVAESTSVSQEASEDNDLFELMMKEAGLPEHLYKGKDHTEMALQIGRMLRQFAQGTTETLATRNMVKSEFRLQQTMIRPVDNNPLKLSPSGDEALKVMLMADSAAYLPAENAIQEGFKDIQAHQLAMMSGIQGAFSHLLSRFEPQKLVRKFDARPRYNKGLLARGKTDYWREYQDYYQDICTMMEDEFQDLFSNEFGKAYESQLRKLR
ncbi:type VI secretion system-associated FHA domain protein TagH [Marinomonas rhizomae]|uniref:type VI secretion system-associated FHA domain protein TagH n=1 Tax=Marinomonas rhizomae TaxID=491948 RepID=UPI0021054F56|nr:type VI secretion system-associated FHA domain protein TagH [Marinomonas rhizomae]UTV99812.1 type VI secretion system-associated FHA domain protein TagH [Marinomonas rhizomae]